MGRQEKALEFTVVSKVVLRRRTQDLTGRMNGLDVLTSIWTNMNITYKMPHVSTKLYSYIYVYTVRNQKSSGVGRRRRRSEVLDLSPLEFLTGRGKEEEKKKKGSNFKQDELISLARTNIPTVWNVK